MNRFLILIFATIALICPGMHAATIYGTNILATTAVSPEKKIVFTPLDGPWSQGLNLISTRSVSAALSATGSFSVKLVQGVYSVAIDGLGKGSIIVPDSTETININECWASLIAFKTAGEFGMVRTGTNDTTQGFLPEKLEAGTNIVLTASTSGGKTTLKINSSAASDWGDIDGVLTNQLDLQAALDLKASLDQLSATNAALLAIATNADNLTVGTVADARIASTITRDSELTSGLATKQDSLGFVPVSTNGGTITAGSIAAISGTTISAATPSQITNALGMIPVNKSGDTMTGPLNLASYTVATLPSASVGAQVYCSDCLTPWGTGDRIEWDGTNWRTLRSRIVATNDITAYLLESLKAGFSGVTAITAAGMRDMLSGPYGADTSGFGFTQGSGATGTKSATADRTTIAYFTGTTATGAYGTQSDKWLPSAGDYATFACAFSVGTLCDGTNNFYIKLGWDANGVGLPNTNAVLLVYDGWNGIGHGLAYTNNFIAMASKASSGWEFADTGVQVGAGTWYNMAIVRSLTNAVFYINGSVVATLNTQLPIQATGTSTAVIQKTLGATSVYLGLDWTYQHNRWATPRLFF